MKKNLNIDDVMTPAPFSIRVDETVGKALEVMKQHGIRHLIVKKEGKFLGLVSDRDLKVASVRQDYESLPVEEFMEGNVYSAAPKTSLSSVVFEMASKKYGCVVIIDPANHHVVGIFTAIDALNILGEFLSGS